MTTHQAALLACALVGCGGAQAASPSAPPAAASANDEAEASETSQAEDVSDLFAAIALGPVPEARARLSAARYEDLNAERARGACLSVLEAMLAGAAETFDLDRHCLARLRELAQTTEQPVPDVSAFVAIQTQAREARLAEMPPLPEGFSAETGERTFSGTLSDDDDRVPDDNSPYDEYPIDLSTGSTLRVDLTSVDFDCYLWLIGPNGQALVQDDDGGEGLNSHFEFFVDVGGRYTLRANAYDGTGRGAYVLRVAIVR